LNFAPRTQVPRVANPHPVGKIEFWLAGAGSSPKSTSTEQKPREQTNEKSLRQVGIHFILPRLRSLRSLRRGFDHFLEGKKEFFSFFGSRTHVRRVGIDTPAGLRSFFGGEKGDFFDFSPRGRRFSTKINIPAGLRSFFLKFRCSRFDFFGFRGAGADFPRAEPASRRETSNFAPRTHVPRRNQHPPSKNPANKHTKKPPAGRNLFYLAPASARFARSGGASINF